MHRTPSVDWDWRNVCTPSDALDEPEVYNVPTSAKGPEYFEGAPHDGNVSLLMVLVGLPARGKTFLAQKLCRLLGWQGVHAMVFNVQVRWRQRLQTVVSPGHSPESPRFASSSQFRDLYRPGSQAHTLYVKVLQEFAEEAKEFYAKGGQVVFLNDDFVTSALRRDALMNIAPFARKTVFLEVQRDAHYNDGFEKLKIQDEYGRRVGISDAKEDFDDRIAALQELYESLEPQSGLSYIKLRDCSVMEVHELSGYLCGRLVAYLMNMSKVKVNHPIYFVRHGQSVYNLDDRLGGNPELTEKGRQDAEVIYQFIAKLKEEDDARAKSDGEGEMQIWTSQLLRARQTAEPAATRLGIKTLQWSSLNEIHAGVCEDMTYDEVARVYPLIAKFRGDHKYTFRYPQGESYQDLVLRIEPLIMALENANRTVIVIAHQAVLRALLAYFGSTSAENSVYWEVPHRTIWKAQYNSKGVASIVSLKLGDAVKGDGSKD